MHPRDDQRIPPAVTGSPLAAGDVPPVEAHIAGAAVATATLALLFGLLSLLEGGVGPRGPGAVIREAATIGLYGAAFVYVVGLPLSFAVERLWPRPRTAARITLSYATLGVLLGGAAVPAVLFPWAPGILPFYGVLAAVAAVAGRLGGPLVARRRGLGAVVAVVVPLLLLAVTTVAG